MQAASDSAFERMFERDKDELRSMGIPVETVVDASGEVRGYRIPQEDYALQDLDLNLAERAAVVVGSQVWGQALIAPLAGSALRKLQSVDAYGWTAADFGGAVQLTASDAALLPLLTAIMNWDKGFKSPFKSDVHFFSEKEVVAAFKIADTATGFFNY